jgi:hypothetical protein
VAKFEIAKYAGTGGYRLRGRPQSPDHVAKRMQTTKLSMRKVQLLCKECGVEFSRASPAQRYCSGKCWNASARRKRPKHDRFRIAPEHYAAILDVQGSRCAICQGEHKSNGKRDSLAVDHCHRTGIVRGLLCHRCNTAIGLFKDDAESLLAAATYLATRSQIYCDTETPDTKARQAERPAIAVAPTPMPQQLLLIN